jgi:hypothetical protein
MQLLEVTKVIDGPMAYALYTAKSLPCPYCKEQLAVEVSPPNLYMYNQGALVQEVLPDLKKHERERFVSGICKPCWKKEFSKGANNE